MNKLRICWLLILLCMGLAGNSQQSASTSDSIVQKLKHYISATSSENIYIQSDKDAYQPGDTIYFKSYVTSNDRVILSSTSSVLHVSLIGPTGIVENHIHLHLDNGIAFGDFTLPSSLVPGYYKLRAYTQWMLNNSAHPFFERSFSIGLNANKQVDQNLYHKAANNKKYGLQFFVEGGSLVSNLKCKVAFHAIGADGLGTKAQGIIFNKAHQPIASFQSVHNGMGYFYLTPRKGEAYQAHCRFSDDTEEDFNLPSPRDTGILLSLQQDTGHSSKLITVAIAANSDYYQINHDQVHFLVMYSGGKATIVNFTQDAPIVAFDLQDQWIYPGVSNLALFSQNGQLLSQRLFFTYPKDSLHITLNSNQASYHKNETMVCRIRAKKMDGKGASSHISVAVVREDSSKIRNQETSIFSDLFLTSSVDGYIEQPDDYFNDTSQEVLSNIDLWMLTKMYERFSWKDVLYSNVPVKRYSPENNFAICGSVTTNANKPIANRQVQLFPTHGGPVKTTTTDAQGYFCFSNLIFFDSTEFVLNATYKGKNEGNIHYFSEQELNNVSQDIAFNDTSRTKLKTSVANKNGAYSKTLPTNKSGHLMDTIRINTQAQRSNIYQNLNSSADQVMHAEEIEQVGGMLSTSLNGRLRGVGFTIDGPYMKAPMANGPMLVILDGVKMNRFDQTGILPYNIDEIPGSTVETVEVLRFASTSIYGMEGANGVLIITTKKLNHYASDTRNQDSSILPIKVLGFYQPRMFHYKNVDSLRHENNLQTETTIYWNADVKTDANGNAELQWNTTGKAGSYKIIIEGIGADGHVGRHVFQYKVEE